MLKIPKQGPLPTPAKPSADRIPKTWWDFCGRAAAWQSTALQALVEKPTKGQTFQATWKIDLLQIAIEEASRYHQRWPEKKSSLFNHQQMTGLQLGSAATYQEYK